MPKSIGISRFLVKASNKAINCYYHADKVREKLKSTFTMDILMKIHSTRTKLGTTAF